MTIQEIFKRKSLQLAIVSALPFLAISSSYAGTSCNQTAGDVVCAGTGADTSLVFNNSGNTAYTDVAKYTDLNGHSVTINSGSTISGSYVTADGNVGVSSNNKVGLYIYSGKNASTTEFDETTLGGLVSGASFNNKGVSVINNGIISLTSDATGTMGNVGIMVSGSNNTITNNHEITLAGSNGKQQWGILIDNSTYQNSGAQANNLANVVNNSQGATISVTNSGAAASTSAVTFKEAVIDAVLNNYGSLSVATNGTNVKTKGWTVYSDDNAGSVTVNNYGGISVSSLTALGADNKNNNAAVFLRAFTATLNNYGTGNINGNVMTRGTNTSFTFLNAGTVNGSFLRYLGSTDADALWVDGGGTGASGAGLGGAVNGNWDGVYHTVYSPVIFAQGSSSQGIGILNGDFRVHSEGDPVGVYRSEVTIKPVLSGAVVADGQSFNLLSSGHVFSNDSPTNHMFYNWDSSYSTALVNWAVDYTGVGTITASRVNPLDINGINSNGANAINAALSFNSDIGAALQNETSAENVRKASEQLRPEVNGASFQTSMVVNDKVLDLVSGRLNQLHTASLTGNTALDNGADTGVWVQAYGGRGNQDKRRGIDGYSLDAYGIAVGADRLFSQDLRLGISGSYGRSNIDGKGDNSSNRNDVDSYQGIVYASKLINDWYLNGLLSVAKHDFTDKRTISLLQSNVNGSHDAWQYSAKLEAGYLIKYQSLTLIPVASLAYSHLSEDGFTESGAGALSINGRDTDSFRSGLGARVLLPLTDSNLKTGLELRGIWNHEFANTAQNTTARFIDGGESFAVNGVDPERDSAKLGASLKMSGVSEKIKQTLSINYDAEIKSHYSNQTASLQARFDF